MMDIHQRQPEFAPGLRCWQINRVIIDPSPFQLLKL
jgi:hypothetical protein